MNLDLGFGNVATTLTLYGVSEGSSSSAPQLRGAGRKIITSIPTELCKFLNQAPCELWVRRDNNQFFFLLQPGWLAFSAICNQKQISNNNTNVYFQYECWLSLTSHSLSIKMEMMSLLKNYGNLNVHKI